jgi:alginate O-acetyltransferase complex protein AlgI
MLFNSFVFVLVFLPLTVIVFFAAGRFSRKAAAAVLAAASLIFYSYWDPRYLILLLASVAINYTAGRAISRARDRNLAWWFAAAGIGADLAILGYYKYADFFITSLNTAGALSIPVLGVVLPIGISFFTFTQIAFLADVYKGGVREYRFIHYLLFVTYFPHLIAGPILHHKEIMPQFEDVHTYEPETKNFTIGFLIFLIGLGKKVLLADTFAAYANPVFDAASLNHSVDFASAWAGTLSYTLQIYFDFSGYTDMAVGLSLLFGIRLPINFNSPYKAISIIDFWRRWHMTLSRFLRDYLYIPLGGNRNGPLRRYTNLLVTMLLGGLWHGASWTFVAWGGLHGLYLIVNHAWAAVFPVSHPNRLRALAAGGTTFMAVVFAWVLFRAPTFRAAANIIQAMVGGTEISTDFHAWSADWSSQFGLQESGERVAATILVGLGLCWFFPNSQEIAYGLQLFRGRMQWGTFGAVAVMIVILLAINASRGVSEFIYFNF